MKIQLAICLISTILILATGASIGGAQAPAPRFRVVCLADPNGIHGPYVVAAKAWLNKLAADENFTIDYLDNAEKINDEFLANYQLIIQLNYPPYGWGSTATAAFEKYIEQG